MRRLAMKAALAAGLLAQSACVDFKGVEDAFCASAAQLDQPVADCPLDSRYVTPEMDGNLNLLSGRRLGGDGDEHAAAVAVSPAGEVLVAGSFTGKAYFKGSPLESKGGPDALLVKLDAENKTQWAMDIGGPGMDQATGVVVLPGLEGEIVVVGTFQGQLTLPDASTLTANSGEESFIIRLTADGVVKAAVRLGSPVPRPGPSSFVRINAIHLTAGGVVVVGEYQGPFAVMDATDRMLTQGPVTRPNTAMFAQSLDFSLTRAQGFATTNPLCPFATAEDVTTVTAGQSTQLVVVGRYDTGNCNFGGLVPPAPSAGNTNAFLGEYAESLGDTPYKEGNVADLWSVRATSTNKAHGPIRIATNMAGLGAVSAADDGDNPAVALSLQLTGGQPRWSHALMASGVAASVVGSSVAMDMKGNTYWAGDFVGELALDGVRQTPAMQPEHSNLFLFAYDAATGVARGMRTLGATTTLSARGTAVDEKGGSLVLVGDYAGQLKLSPTAVLNAQGGSDLFLMRFRTQQPQR